MTICGGKGAGTEILDESDGSGNMTNEYVFFGGKRIAMDTITGGSIGSTYYYAEDFLGSSRAMVQSGATSACFDADFLPFGREKDALTTCAVNNYKFEGKERDTETGNDDFGARYYSSNFGRWLSPDWSSVPAPVPYANLANPQTLNLYAMVEDDPESFADLDGHVNTPGTASQTGTCNVESWDGCDDLGQSRAWALHESAAGYTWQQIADIINGEAPAGAAYALTFTPLVSVAQCLKDIAACQQAQAAGPKPKNQPEDPAPTGPDGKPAPPSVPVPGCSACGWVWSPDSRNPRGGRWVPDKNLPPGVQPGSGSWDTGSRGGPGHWDIDDGNGSRTRYYPNGAPMPDHIAHPPGWRPIWNAIGQWAGDHRGAIIVGGVVVGGAIIIATGGAAAPAAAAFAF